MLAALMILASLGLFIFLILGIIGFFNASWVGMKNKKQSALVYFSATIICLVIGVSTAPAVSNQRANETESNLNRITTENKNTVDNDSTVSTEVNQAHEDKNVQQTIQANLMELIDQFKPLTDIQKEKWENENGFKFTVNGHCIVSEVAKTTWISEIPEAAFEVDCELPSEDRAILFIDKNQTEFATSLNKGDVINFHGKVKKLIDWGLWTSAYIIVE